MARVTVEDCILNVPNRFELVGVAAQRAKRISAGDPLTVDRDNDKDAVVALREIAENTVEIEKLREEIVEAYSRYQRPDVIEGEEQRVVGAYPAPSRRSSMRGISEDYEEETEADSETAMIGELPEGMSFGDEEVDNED